MRATLTSDFNPSLQDLSSIRARLIGSSPSNRAIFFLDAENYLFQLEHNGGSASSAKIMQSNLEHPFFLRAR